MKSKILFWEHILVLLLGVLITRIPQFIFIFQFRQLQNETTSFGLIIKGILMGMRYSTTIGSYILLLPLLLSLIGYLFNIRHRFVNYFNKYFYILLWSIVLIINTADIPYFKHFSTHISNGAFTWIDTPVTSFKMILWDTHFWPYIILTLVLIEICSRLIKLIYKGTTTQRKHKGIVLFQFILLLPFIFVGLRGEYRPHRHPIHIFTCNFSDDVIINEASIDPTFYLIKMVSKASKNKNIHFMPSKKAQKYYSENHKLVRSKQNTHRAQKKNLVVVIMESMATAKMGYFGNTQGLTPFLDSLAQVGQTYTHFYSQGQSTHYGIAGVLSSLPSLFNKQQLHFGYRTPYHGLPISLKENGYTNFFFIPHKEDFDNVRGYANRNKYDHIFTEKNYPSEKIISPTWGVSDDYLFEFGIDHISKLHKNEEPFFATFLTISDHTPYIVPDYFKAKSKDTKLQIVEFADWSLQQFIRKASKQPWYSNTIFAFVADHGVNWEQKGNNRILDKFHIPFIIWDPSGELPSKRIDDIGSQIDIYPTLMGILDLPYTNKTQGIDLNRAKRKYAYFSTPDDKYYAIDKNYLWENTYKYFAPKLYDLKQNNLKDIITNHQDIASPMQAFVESEMQCCYEQYYSIKKDKTNEL